MVVFRSLLIPLQAAVMNLLSIGASLGVIVAIFQWGWLGGAVRRAAGTDRVVHPGDAVRDRVRPVDGLRGVPRVAHPRALDAHARQRARRRRGPRAHRARRHRRRSDHGVRIPVVHARRRPRHQGVRPQPRERRVPRRARRPLPAAARHAQPARQRHVVAARLARAAAAAPEHRGLAAARGGLRMGGTERTGRAARQRRFVPRSTEAAKEGAEV